MRLPAPLGRISYGPKGQYTLAQGIALGTDNPPTLSGGLKAQYNFMSQSLARIYLHIIFSTKERYPFMVDAIRPELFAYIGDTIKRIDGVPYLINGTDDHIHILSTLPRTISPAKYIEEIKRNSSRWIKTKDINWQCEKFAWQNGYGVFSISESAKAQVMEYIANQQEHHRTITFQEECVAFLKKYNVGYDEKYLWV